MDKLKHRPYTKLKTELTRRNVRYGDVGKLLGISVSAVCNKINGRSDFLISEMSCIESTYQISRSVFLPEKFR